MHVSHVERTHDSTEVLLLGNSFICKLLHSHCIAIRRPCLLSDGVLYRLRSNQEGVANLARCVIQALQQGKPVASVCLSQGETLAMRLGTAAPLVMQTAEVSAGSLQ